MWNWLGITNEPKVTVNIEETGKELPEAQTDENVKETEEHVDVKKEEAGNVEKKVTEVAANLGNYIYNFASVATRTATETASKIKDTVDNRLDQSIIADFERENEKFIQEKENRRLGDAVPPWVGFHEEKVMKSQISALSADERNFLRDPPSGVDFQFRLEHMMPIAISVLKEDKDLEAMRFNLVPKKIKEERFWRNYFYRVSLIKQSTQLSSLSLKDAKKSPRSSSSESLNKSSEKVEQATTQSTTTPDSPNDDVLDDVAGSPTADEFISDAFDDNAHLSEEEKTQMLGLKDDQINQTDGNTEGIEENTNNDWDLDKELQEELESFELVNTNEDDKEWQKEIEELLEEDNK